LSLFLKNLYIFISLRENVCDSHLKKSRTWQERSSLDGQVDTKDQSQDIRCRQSHLRISIRRYKPHRGRLQFTRRLFMVSCQSRTRMTHIDSIAAVPECSAAARTRARYSRFGRRTKETFTSSSRSATTRSFYFHDSTNDVTNATCSFARLFQRF